MKVRRQSVSPYKAIDYHISMCSACRATLLNIRKYFGNSEVGNLYAPILVQEYIFRFDICCSIDVCKYESVTMNDGSPVSLCDCCLTSVQNAAIVTML